MSINIIVLYRIIFNKDINIEKNYIYLKDLIKY